MTIYQTKETAREEANCQVLYHGRMGSLAPEKVQDNEDYLLMLQEQVAIWKERVDEELAALRVRKHRADAEAFLTKYGD